MHFNNKLLLLLWLQYVSLMGNNIQINSNKVSQGFTTPQATEFITTPPSPLTSSP